MIEIVADIFGNIMGTLYPHNVRRRGFMRFCKIFAVIQSVKVGSKIDFSCFLMKFHPKSILRNENKFFIPRGGLVLHFGLLLVFTPTRWGWSQKEISEQAHSLSCQTEKSKMQISAKNTENKIWFLKLLPKFVIHNVAEIFGNIMGILYFQNIRTRSFVKFYLLFAKL